MPFNNLIFEKLPPPYDGVQPLRDLVEHGWYTNGPYLHPLIQDHDIKIIVEIGSWLGTSTIDLARHLPENGLVYAIDHWLGSLEHQLGEEAWHPCLPHLYEQFLSNVIHAKLTHKIIPIRMSSLAAAEISDFRPDLIYIDASHEAEAVYKDLQAWYPFVKGSGILCGDDWGWESVRSAVILFAQNHQLSIKASDNFWHLLE